MVVGVDAYLCSNLQAFFHNGSGAEIGVPVQRSGTAQRIAASRADGGNVIVWFDNLSRARDDKDMLTIGNNEKSL